MKNIIITKHAFERAKQRLSDIINAEQDLVFQYEIKKLFKKSVFNYSDGNINCFCLLTTNHKITFKVIVENNQYIIITILVNKNEIQRKRNNR